MTRLLPQDLVTFSKSEFYHLVKWLLESKPLGSSAGTGSQELKSHEGFPLSRPLFGFQQSHPFAAAMAVAGEMGSQFLVNFTLLRRGKGSLEDATGEREDDNRQCKKRPWATGFTLGADSFAGSKAVG